MPVIVPLPPAVLVPPITTAAIASNSNPAPALGWPVVILEANKMPAKPANKPEIEYTDNFTRSILIPEALAACSLPPMA